MTFTIRQRTCAGCGQTFTGGATQRRFGPCCPSHKRKPRTYTADQVGAKAAYDRAYYAAHLKPRRTAAVRMVGNARTRARVHGVPFSITPDNICIPQFCPVLGIPLIVGEGLFTDNSPSLDRFKPSLGYVPGNVYVISYRANRLKSNATIDELQRVLNYMKGQP